ncbi:MGD A: Monogalactosyldiacylglycerol synthase chloroplastic [Bienertia sinuspersici]
MAQPSTVNSEPSNLLEFVSKLGPFALNASYKGHSSNGYSSLSPNHLGSNLKKILTDFNKAIRLHCDRIPLGFSSIGLNSEESNGVNDNRHGVLEDVRVPMNGVEPETPKRVLILMSDTGGGHRASAEAIKSAFNEEFGDDYQVFVTDLWSEHTPWPFNQLPRSYNFLVKHGPLWKMMYYGTAPRPELRKELGLDEQLPAVLLMGGGEGMGPIEATARALGRALYDENIGEPIGQVLVICGRNKKLAGRLRSIDWKIPVQVKGFVTKMEECMGACDCIITKAGPGTIAESMIRGLPIILNDYIAGQEAGNVPYVLENGIGKYLKSPKAIANTVAQWFGPKADELQIMSQNALKHARPDAVFKIVHDLHELIRQRSFVQQYSCAA